MEFLEFIAWAAPQLKLTPRQTAVAEVLGGSDPKGELALQVWGFEGPVLRECRRIVALRLGRRSFKSTLAALYALWRAMTCDLTEAGGGAEVVIPIVAPGDDKTRLVLKMAIHYADKGPLRDCINIASHEEARSKKAVTARSLHLVRPSDGLAVEIRACVASAGGKNLVGFHVPAMIVDEAERMRIDSEAGITDKEQIDAAEPALLPGGAIVLISTPYDLDSYMHKHVERNYAHPVDGLACIGRTLDMRPESQMLRDMYATAMLREPAVAMRDYDCVPIGRPDAYFSVAVVDACTRELTVRTRAQVSGASDLAFVSDGCAQVIIERQGNRIVMVFESFEEPTPGAPLIPSVIRQRQKDAFLAYGCFCVSADVHEWASLCESLVPAGIQVARAPLDRANVTAFALTRDLMRSGRLDVLPRTAEQLKRVQTKNDGSPGLPRNAGSGHCDLVSALVSAVWLDRRHGPLDGGQAEKPMSLRGGWIS